MKPKRPSTKDFIPHSPALSAILSEPQIPEELRVQVFKLMTYSFGGYYSVGHSLLDYVHPYDQVWDNLVESFEYKKGRRLSGQDGIDKVKTLIDYADMGEFITIILIFLAQAALRYSGPTFTDTMKFGDGVEETNRLFREHKIAYKFSVDKSGTAHATDVKSTYLHGNHRESDQFAH